MDSKNESDGIEPTNADKNKQGCFMGNREEFINGNLYETRARYG